MGVLKPARGNESVGMTIKVPKKLHDRITIVKERCKSKGFAINLAEGAIKGLSKLVGDAEKELDALDSKQKVPPAQKKDSSSSSATPTHLA
jgi:hypothetical protein